MTEFRKTVANLVTTLKGLDFLHRDDVVTGWSATVSDDNLASEKLVKDSLDGKASSTDLTNGLTNIGGWTIHTVYSVSGSASAFDISSGLLYAQQSPVFFLVKNIIGDNEANATLKYYPNGNNITILDAFSSNSASPIQQSVWKKDTWALFFCYGNNTVQLRCVFYDSVDINEIKSNIANILGIEILPYYVVSSVSKDKRVTYNIDDYTIFDGNSFYLKVPYYETSTDIKVTLKTTSASIMQGSDYVTESQVNGHLLKLRYNNGNFEVLNIYDNDKLIPLFSDLSTVATTGSYNDLSNKPTIPTVPTNVSAFTNDSGYLTAHQDISGKEDKSNKVTSLSSSSTDTEYPSAKAVFDSLPSVPSASSTTPSADTTEGSVGTGTTWARSNHTHPKSDLYAEASHTHLVEDLSNITVVKCYLNNADGKVYSDSEFTEEITSPSNIAFYNVYGNNNNSILCISIRWINGSKETDIDIGSNALIGGFLLPITTLLWLMKGIAFDNSTHLIKNNSALNVIGTSANATQLTINTNINSKLGELDNLIGDAITVINGTGGE